MITITPASESDTPVLLRMSEQFYPMTEYNLFAPFDTVTITNLINSLRDDHVLLVIKVDEQVVGFAGAYVLPWLFNSSVKTGHEVIFWVDPEYRGGQLGLKLMVALEVAVKDAGAVTLQMVHFVHIRGAEKIYQALGYTHTEDNYIKRI